MCTTISSLSMSFCMLYVAQQVVMAVIVSVVPFDALFSAVSTRTYYFHDPCVFICDSVEFGVTDSVGKLQHTTEVSRVRSTNTCTKVEHSLARKPVAEADCSNFVDCDFVLAHTMRHQDSKCHRCWSLCGPTDRHDLSKQPKWV